MIQCIISVISQKCQDGLRTSLFLKMTVGAVTEVWAGLSGVVGRQWKQVEAGRFGAMATRRFLPQHSPLRLCSWPTYAKALAPLFFLKKFLTCTFP